MDLTMDIDDLIKLLIADNKINAVREAVISDGYKQLMHKERLNYCTKEELMEIIKDENVMSIMVEYEFNDEIIDCIVDEFPENMEIVKKMVSVYVHKLKPRHIDILFTNVKIKNLILSHQARLCDETCIYLHSKGLLKNLTYHQKDIIVSDSKKDCDIKSLKLVEITAITYNKTFTPEEVDIVLDMIFSLDMKYDLKTKGNMEMILSTQEVPDYALKKIITEWKYDLSEPVIESLLKKQKLDTVLDYILDNHTVGAKTVECILNNSKTSTKKLSRLYEKYSSQIVSSNPKKLPVLECHIHMS